MEALLNYFDYMLVFYFSITLLAVNLGIAALLTVLFARQIAAQKLRRLGWFVAAMVLLNIGVISYRHHLMGNNTWVYDPVEASTRE